jgi:hypothetical protein
MMTVNYVHHTVLVHRKCTAENMVLAVAAFVHLYLTLQIIVFIIVIVISILSNHCRFMLELLGTVSNSILYL